MIWLTLIFGGLFTWLSWKQFRLGVQLFLIALPSYLIRLTIGPMPTTLLEVMFGALFLAWLIRYSKTDLPKITLFFTQNKLLTWSLAVFFIASISGIFISDMWYYSFGQWRAFFLQPVLFFIILIGHRDTLSRRDIALALLVSTFSISLVAILQKITGYFYPPSLWDDQLFGRVTSFFTSPNAVGLYLAPLVPLVALFVLSSRPRIRIIAVVATVLAILAVLFTRSLGAWVGLVAGTVIFMFSFGYKKMTAVVVVLGILMAALLPQTKTLLLSKEKSSSNRRALWTMSVEYLTESPKNFIFGTGIRQFFRKVQKENYNPKELERLIYPHNIFLNFWTEIGLLGMLGFLGILWSLFLAAKNSLRENKFTGAALLAALTVLVVHGLVDAPYFKNDLSFLFWAIAALVVLKNPGQVTQDSQK